MQFLALCQQIMQDIWAHKLRSSLALFGISWGTVAVVLLLAIGQGFYEYQVKEISFLTEGTAEVFLQKTSKPYQGLPIGRELSLDVSTVVKLPTILPEVARTSPNITQSASVVADTKQTHAAVLGVAPEYAAIKQWQAQAGGRFLDELDVKMQRRVVFLGAKISDSLFSGRNALHRQILVNGIPFTVIGVRDTRQQQGLWLDEQLFIPYSTAITLWGNREINWFLAQVKNPEQTADFESSLMRYLARLKSFAPTDSAALQIFDYTSLRVFFLWFFRAFQIFLGLCGSLTLAVGAIGIANTLFLIVRERTQEIGLRKAMGAQNYQILMQFLLETALLVGLGGLLGIVLSVIIIGLLRALPWAQNFGAPVLSLPILLSTTLLLVILALLAGYFPARRAAKLMPVEALVTPPC